MASSGFPNQYSICISLHHSCYMPWRSLPPQRDLCNYTCRRVQVMRLLVIQLSPASYHLSLLELDRHTPFTPGRKIAWISYVICHEDRYDSCFWSSAPCSSSCQACRATSVDVDNTNFALIRLLLLHCKVMKERNWRNSWWLRNISFVQKSNVWFSTPKKMCSYTNPWIMRIYAPAALCPQEDSWYSFLL
jgi:hypothetical protein